MNMKHTVKIITSPELLRVNEDGAEVDVIWSVDFNRELDMYFNKKKYKHNFDLLKTGVGRLTVKFDLDKKHSTEVNLAFIEALAAKHIVANSGLNAFGFTDDKISIRRDHLQFVFSKQDAGLLIERSKRDAEYFGAMGVLAAKSAPAAGYLFGATTEMGSDFSWADGYLKPDAEFDFYNRISEVDIRYNDYAYTPLGYIIIDYRTVNEFMSNQLTRYEEEVHKKVFSRPFDTVAEMVNNSKDVIYTDNHYLDKIRARFGNDALLLSNKEEKAWLPIIPLPSSEGYYLMLGVSRYMSPLTIAELHKHGYALDVPQTLTEEELLEAQQQRFERYGRKGSL